MADIDVSLYTKESLLEINPNVIEIEITGLKSVNKFIYLEDTPLYYEDGKFLKVENNRIVYADIEWEVKRIVDEAVNTHNIGEESHPFINNRIDVLQQDVSDKYEEVLQDIDELSNVVDENYSTLDNKIDTTKQDLETSIQSLDVKLSKDIDDLDVKLSQEITDLNDDLNDEIVAREEADTTLQGNIDTLTQTESDHYSELDGRIEDLSDTVDANKTDSESRDTALGERIDNEANTRGEADTALQNQINLQNQILTSHDSKITDNSNAISQEIVDRQNADDALSDRIDVVESRGRFLALWNATTGLPESTPQITPYTYKTGDYYIVDAVGETNYRPTGTEFVEGQASTEIETEELTTDDVYYYDGAVWRLQVNHGKTVSFGNLTGQPSDNTALKQALDSKQDNLTENNAGNYITIIPSGQSLLPEDYTQLEYIESTGTQWILTNFIPQVDDIVIADVQSLNTSEGKDKMFFGQQNIDANNGGFWIEMYGTLNMWYTRYASSSSTSGTSTTSDKTKRITITIDKNTFKTSGGSTLDLSSKYAGTIQSTPLEIFNRRSTAGEDNISLMRLYRYTTIRDNSNVLDLIPAKRNIDNVLGLYDIVENEFYINQGSGDFIAGEEVITKTKISADLSSKQDVLVSGTNIKTLNNESILGSGNIDTTSAQWGNITGTLSSQTDLKNALDLKQNITDNNLVTTDKTVVGAVNELDAKIKEIELYKTPNVLIQGEPTINNGQVTGFSKTAYLILPFEFNVGDRGFELTYAFRTGSDVTTAQNLFGSKFSIASYILGGKLTIRVSSNGTSWDVLDLITSLDIQPNTTYYIKLIFNKLSYEVKLSADGVEYSQIGRVVDTRPPFAGDVYIGIGNNTNNPFLGMINLHKWELKYNNVVFWEGMDDAGLATRADISLSNLDEIGQAKFDAKQNKLNQGANIILTPQEDGTVTISASGGLSEVSWGGITGELSNQTDLQNALDSKQNTLVSGTNIKTLNNESLLGSGNIDITSAQWGNITGDIEDQTDLSNTLQNVREVAEGKTKSYVVSYVNNPVFNTQDAEIKLDSTFIDINDVVHNIEELKLGDNIFVQETDVPDRWCSQPSKKSLLPEDYTQLAYIQSNGTQYINTGIMLGRDYVNTNIKIEYEAIINTGTNWQVCGTLGSVGIYIGVDSTNTIYYSCGTNDTSTGVKNTFTKCKWINDGKNGIVKVEDLSNKNTIVDINYTPVTKTQNVPIIICGFSTNETTISNSKLGGKIYTFKVYNNETLIADFIPAIQNNDNTIGMYDIVSNKFFTNSGTGEFIAGQVLDKSVTLYKLETSKVDLTDFATKEDLEAKQDVITDLDSYVKNTDYATATKAGVVRVNNVYKISSASTGLLQTITMDVATYQDARETSFIGKGTLENIKENLVTGVGDTKYQPIGDYATKDELANKTRIIMREW